MDPQDITPEQVQKLMAAMSDGREAMKKAASNPMGKGQWLVVEVSG